MARLEGYEQILVQQQEAETGCIPTGIEWMVRYALSRGGAAGFQELDLADFQKRFDFDIGASKCRNDFDFVPAAVTGAHPELRFRKEVFQSGADKLRRLEDLVELQLPCLLPDLNSRGKFHVKPVVKIEAGEVTLLTLNGDSIEQQRETLPAAELVRRHDNAPGGKDILIWEEKPEN